VTTARSIDPALRDALLARIRFYRDLGLTEFYRRPVDPALTLSTELGAPSFPQLFAERVETSLLRAIQPWVPQSLP
jgi:hypothetical protein